MCYGMCSKHLPQISQQTLISIWPSIIWCYKAVGFCSFCRLPTWKQCVLDKHTNSVYQTNIQTVCTRQTYKQCVLDKHTNSVYQTNIQTVCTRQTYKQCVPDEHTNSVYQTNIQAVCTRQTYKQCVLDKHTNLQSSKQQDIHYVELQNNLLCIQNVE